MSFQPFQNYHFGSYYIYSISAEISLTWGVFVWLEMYNLSSIWLTLILSGNISVIQFSPPLDKIPVFVKRIATAAIKNDGCLRCIIWEDLESVYTKMSRLFKATEIGDHFKKDYSLHYVLFLCLVIVWFSTPTPLPSTKFFVEYLFPAKHSEMTSCFEIEK